MSLSAIQAEVGQWSRDNFGDQISKATHQVLGSLAPLLGIVEELGELAAAYVKRGKLESCDVDSYSKSRLDSEFNAIDAEISDALSDVMVYMCDWAFREGDVDLDKLVALEWIYDPCDIGYCTDTLMLRATKAVGRLCHVVLKRHQGIRGYDNYSKYGLERNLIIAQLLTILDVLASEEGLVLEEILQATWDKVKSRNWKARPVDANEHEVV